MRVSMGVRPTGKKAFYNPPIRRLVPPARINPAIFITSQAAGRARSA